MSEPEKTTEQAIREAAWVKALTLRFRWDEAADRAYGKGGGYADPHAVAEHRRLRTLLDAIVEEHSFQGTRADPMINWVAEQAASWDCPPMVEVQS